MGVIFPEVLNIIEHFQQHCFFYLFVNLEPIPNIMKKKIQWNPYKKVTKEGACYEG